MPCRLGAGCYPARLEMRSLVAHVVFRPDGFENIQRFVEKQVPFLEIDTERRILRPQIPGRRTENEPLPRQHVHGRDRLCQHEWVPIRQHEDVGHQVNSIRDGGTEGQRREGVEGVVPPAFQPLL